MQSLIYFLLVSLGYRKQVIYNNLKKGIPSIVDQNELAQVYKGVLKNTARVAIESIASHKYLIQLRTKFLNVEKLEEASQNGGVVVLAAHYGNWEIACSALPLHTNIPVYGVYKPLKNKGIDQCILDLRAKYGLHLVARNKIARKIAEHAAQSSPAIYILIADQNPNSINDVIWTDFLGQKTAHTQGPEKITMKYNLPAAYMQVTSGNKMYEYNIQFDLDFESNDLMQEYSDKLSHQIIDHPEYWLWSHRRWKRKYQGS